MKRFALLTMTAAALLMLPPAYPQQAGAGRGATAPRLVSPEIHADRTVTFRLSAPKANEVTLNGSWEAARDIKMGCEQEFAMHVGFAGVLSICWVGCVGASVRTGEVGLTRLGEWKLRGGPRA